MRSLKPLKWAGVAFATLVVALAIAQLVQPKRADFPTDSSHTIQATLEASSALGPVLDRACGECHSNTMSSRWYTRFVPFSYIIARAANDGRKAVNFSEWTAYSPDQRRVFLVSSCSDATRGTMPVPASLRFRPDAKLSPRDVATICDASR